jgi:hypothetical protein
VLNETHRLATSASIVLVDEDAAQAVSRLGGRGSSTGQLLTDRAVLGKVFSEVFGFRCQFSIYTHASIREMVQFTEMADVLN